MATMTPLYELENIRHGYDGRTVLAIDHLVLHQKGITGFFGPNGAGKSTLLGLLALVFCPASGRIRFAGRDSRTLGQAERRQITILPQDPRLLRRSVGANLAYGLRLRRQTGNLEARIDDALDMVGLSADFAGRPWNRLSGGETRRVALAARLILKPRVLILDEPTAGVDDASAGRIREAVFHARSRWGTSLLIASHDRDWLEQVCDQRIGLLEGRVIGHAGINQVPGPWTMACGRMTRLLPDGQRLALAPPAAGAEAGVALIEPTAIRVRQALQSTGPGLNGTITAVRGHADATELLLDIGVAGLHFQAQLPAEQARRLALWPGTRVRLTINQAGVRWVSPQDSKACCHPTRPACFSSRPV